MLVHLRVRSIGRYADEPLGSELRPGGMAAGRDAFIGYSPYVRPMLVGGVKCVLVDERLRDIERMAFDFVMNFAKDNDLPVVEGCELPERSRGPSR